MRFAILSDIHGNIYALKEAFKKIEDFNIDQIILCGDYITDVPRANEVIDFLREVKNKFPTYIIKGNREEKVLSYENKQKEIMINDQNIFYTYKSLTNENLEFIKTLPDSYVIENDNIPKIFVSHVRNYSDGLDCKYKIFGHSHRQHIFSRDGIKYINPGSIGLPTDGDPRLKFCVLTIEDDLETIEMFSIKYDYEKAIKDLENAEISKNGIKWGLAVKKLIETGIDYPRMYLDEVVKIAKEYGIETSRDKLPIDIWNEARRSLKIN